MVYQEFLIGTALILLGHALLVGYAGLRLAGNALLSVFGIWLFASALWFGFGHVAPPGSLTFTVIFVPLFVCFEDFIRTWFVGSRVRRHASVAASSLAFAVVASLVEIVVQTSNLIAATTRKALELPVTGDVEFFDAFFSSYAVPLAAVGLNAIRPGIHYLLCVSLFYAWRVRRWSIYAALIATHAAVDVAIELVAETHPVNYPISAFGIAVIFALLLFAATLWIRAITKQRCTDRAWPSKS